MRITTKISWDIETMAVLEHEHFEYSGPIEEVKGGSESKKIMWDQLALEKDAYYNMKRLQKNVEDNVNPFLSGKVGYDPEMLAATRSASLNQLAQNYDTAGKNVRTAMLRKGATGSDTRTGGDYTRGLSALEGGLASDRSSSMLNIDMSNLQTALQNRWNAINAINGQAAQMASPVGSFTSGTTGALDAYIKAANSGFGSAFAQSFGSTLGQGVGKIATGGLSWGSGFGPGAKG